MPFLHYFSGLRLLFLLLVASQITAARPLSDYQVIHYGDESLPQLSIGGIARDERDYLWLCTQMGLVRFDGQQFRRYIPANTPALKGMRSRFFFTNKAQRLYYWDDSYSFYEIRNNQFIPVSASTYSSIIAGQVASPPGFRYRSLPPADKMPVYVAGQLMDPARMVYYVLGRDTAVLPHVPPVAYGFFGDKVFFVSGNHSVTVQDPGHATARKSAVTGDMLKNPLWQDTMALLRGCYQPGKLFLQLGNTLYTAQPDGNNLHTAAFITNLDIKLISCIYEDEKNGYLAIGTQMNGLYILFPKSFSTRILKGGTALNSCYQIGQLRDNIYLNSMGYEFDLFRDYERPVVNAKGHGCYRHGDYLITGTDAGVRGINVKTGAIKTFIADMRPNGWFLQGYDDPWGRSWIAGSNGFASFDTLHNTFRWMPLFNNATVAGADNIEAFHFLNKDTVMIGCRRGLILLNVRTNATVNVPEMHGKNVRYFVATGDGGVWVLTYGHGYYYYKHGRFTAMPMDRNNYLESVHTMLLDRRGFYWMSSNKGLFRTDRKALLKYVADTTSAIRYEYFNKNCGFESNEFNGGCSPCGYIASDSLFLLPNMIGLVHFNPLGVRTPPMSNPVYIDKVMIDGKEVPPRSVYTLPSGRSSFYCEVSSPFFGLPENLVLEYRIEGLGNNWQPLINNRYLQFNRLPYGSYKLQIRKLVSFSGDNYARQTILIRVPTPVYLHTWFLVLAGILVLFLLWLVVLLRVRLLTRQKQKLEQQVEERTDQLARSLGQLKETIVTLEQSQAALYVNNRFREQLTAIVLHDIQTPLRFLKRVVKNVQQTYRSLPPEQLGAELDELYHATDEVTSYSQDFLVWIKSHKEGFTIAPRRLNVLSLLQETGNLYQKIGQNVGADITINCPPDLELETDPALISIIIRNLADNAIKYAPEGAIRFNAERAGDRVVIGVADNGRGMPPEQVAALLNDDQNSLVMPNGKLGYQLIKDLLRVLDGTLHIDSSPGKGTGVWLYFNAERYPHSKNGPE